MVIIGLVFHQAGHTPSTMYIRALIRKKSLRDIFLSTPPLQALGLRSTHRFAVGPKGPILRIRSLRQGSGLQRWLCTGIYAWRQKGCTRTGIRGGLAAGDITRNLFFKFFSFFFSNFKVIQIEEFQNKAIYLRNKLSISAIDNTCAFVVLLSFPILQQCQKQLLKTST